MYFVLGLSVMYIEKFYHFLTHGNTFQVTGRRDRAKPLPFKMEGTGPWGFAGANDGNPKISAKFVAPCYYLNK